MFPPLPAVYRNKPHSITLVLDTEAANAHHVLRSFRDAFGEHHSDIEALDPPRHVCLHLYPGGVLELAG